jgi:Cof subfamily protein (haloacid dehalogenase superfamily)
MPVKLIALDIDGTLLDSRFQLPEANRKAVVEAASRGIEVALVTGRRFDFALPIAQQFDCPLTLIVNNGAVVKSKDGTTHLRHLLPRGVARQVLEATPQFRHGTAAVFDRPLQNQVIYEFIDWDDPQQKGYLARNLDYIAQVSPLTDALTEDPIQVMFMGKVEPMCGAEALLRSLPFADRYALAVTVYKNRDFSMIDVIHPACSKGAALEEWVALRGLRREEVMAIGDNHNDREMLTYAGVPIVMGNCVEELKTLGWRQTLSNDDCGVAAAIEEYAFGGG